MAIIDSRTPTVDTYLDSSQATTRQDSSSWISFRILGGVTRRPVFKWDLSAIAGGTITTGTLTLNNQAGATGGYDVSIYRITGNSPTNACTWNTYDGANAWTSAGGDYYATPITTLSSTGRNVTGQDWVFDISSWLQDVADGTYTDYGLIAMWSTGTAVDGKWDPQSDATEADRPQLYIDYEEGAGGVRRYFSPGIWRTV